MSEMIERVAQAIHDHWQNGPGSHAKTWAETCGRQPAQADDFRAKARAALETLVTPTKEMVTAGMAHVPFGYGRTYPKVIWQAMIDEALKETE